VEARSQGRVGVFLRGDNARRGSASSHRVTPACLERILRMRKPSKSGLGNESNWQAPNPTAKNGTEGR
jgi:hypothetical protein